MNLADRLAPAGPLPARPVRVADALVCDHEGMSVALVHERATLWERVDALIDRAPSHADLRSHGLQLLAARRFRATGQGVPADFRREERAAAVAALTAPVVLERVVAAIGADCILLKGPEAARRYPDPGLRGFGDVDVLTRDAPAAQRALLAAGFTAVGDPRLYEDIHHLRPLVDPGLRLPIEVHAAPKWVAPLRPPSVDELFEAAVPSAVGVPGVLGLPAEHQSVLLAVHSWAHEPLRRLRDLVDVAATVAWADRAEAMRLANRWGVGQLWTTTLASVDALFGDGDLPLVLRIWGQNLPRTRERTVLENHLQRLLSDFWAVPAPTALRRLPQALGHVARPDEEEGWREKLARTSRALRNRSRRRSEHEQEMERGQGLRSEASSSETVTKR